MINEGVNQVEKLVAKIIDKRTEKGLSLENVANSLGISTGAYHKIERQESKLSVERLFLLSEILDVKISELLDLPSENSFYQHVESKATGFQQHTLYQDNKEIIKQFTDSLKEEITYLRKRLDGLEGQ